MHASDYEYDLPPALIAQAPLPVRDACRLLRLNRENGHRDHRRFGGLPLILRKGDLLVLNNTRVLPARLLGFKLTGGHAEILLARRVIEDKWLALTRPGLSAGQTVKFESGLSAIVERCAEAGQRIIRFDHAGTELDELIHRVGLMPIPPYVKSQPVNPDDYQTVYARHEGSVAAPTAGLHFTTALLDQLRAAGIDALITNFHLPRSTLLMLVSAFAGRDQTLDTYREAIERGYRFYSFGDAMLIE